MSAEHDIDLLIAQEFFSEKKTGVLVEIGAAGPQFLSIGNSFRKKGWRVISIEPNPMFASMHRELGHEVYEYACAEIDQDDVDFTVADCVDKLQYSDGHISAESFSSLGIRDKYKDLFSQLSTKFALRNIKVKARRLDAILESLKDVESIDVVAIDVEGWELECLKGFSFGVYKPKVIIVENLFNSSDYVNFMKCRGYQHWRTLGPNDIYLLENRVENKVPVKFGYHGDNMISYTLNLEDVLLRRCFHHVKNGFYVDIGAHHPTHASVTRWFYDTGWCGINIEPGAGIEALKNDRKRDVNLKVAVSDKDGESLFWVHTANSGTSTLLQNVPSSVSDKAGEIKSTKIQVSKLSTILNNYASGQHIHFLKIDAEGAENAIITASDWQRHRPEVLVVESTEPYTSIRRNEEWQDVLKANRYIMAYFDGVNDFWVREESAHLLEAFKIPVNVLDYFQMYDDNVEQLKLKIDSLTDQLNKSVMVSLIKKIREKLKRIKIIHRLWLKLKA